MKLVVDASVAIKWFSPEELSQAADGLLRADYALTAPNFLLIECGSIIWKKCRRREMTRRDGDDALAVLRSGLVDLTPTGPLLEGALVIAHEIGHSFYDCIFYDCIYLAAAETTGGVVVTADRRFVEVVASTRLKDRIAWIETPPEPRT